MSGSPPIRMLREDARPLYVQAEEALHELLGRSEPGSRLPPEPELARQFGISRSTLREALRAFEGRGLIARRQGRGTFVTTSRPVIESGLEVLESFDALAGRKGFVPATEDLLIEEQPASHEYANHLAVPVGTPLIVVSRTRTADGVPVAHMVDAVPASCVSLLEMRVGFRGSVLDFLLARGEPVLAYARASVVPQKAGRVFADKLRIEPGAVVLLLAETLFTPDGEAAGYSYNYFVPEFFSFYVVRHIHSEGAFAR